MYNVYVHLQYFRLYGIHTFWLRVAFITLCLIRVHVCTCMCVGLSGLRELSLDNTIITDQGIKYIAGTHKNYEYLFT